RRDDARDRAPLPRHARGSASRANQRRRPIRSRSPGGPAARCPRSARLRGTRRFHYVISASICTQLRTHCASYTRALHAAAVVIAPLRIAGGTRLKIYETMAARRPVVATTIGVEGLNYRAGEDIVSADGPGDFAKAVIRLL